jgi:hypothetical protein
MAKVSPFSVIAAERLRFRKARLPVNGLGALQRLNPARMAGDQQCLAITVHYIGIWIALIRLYRVYHL